MTECGSCVHQRVHTPCLPIHMHPFYSYIRFIALQITLLLVTGIMESNTVYIFKESHTNTAGTLLLSGMFLHLWLLKNALFDPPASFCYSASNCSDNSDIHQIGGDKNCKNKKKKKRWGGEIGTGSNSKLSAFLARAD